MESLTAERMIKTEHVIAGYVAVAVAISLIGQEIVSSKFVKNCSYEMTEVKELC